jgi:hypothetical protein
VCSSIQQRKHAWKFTWKKCFNSKGPFKLPDLISLSFFCLPFFFLAELAIQFPGYENRHAEEEILTHVMCNQ